MKTSYCKLVRYAPLLTSACLLAGAASLHAQEGKIGGFYMNTDLGVNLMDDASVPFRYFGTPVVGLASLDAGLRWDYSFGYAFKIADQLTLGPELETGILYNSVDQYKLGGGVFPASGNYFQVPLIASLVMSWHFNPHWVAYVGGGGGMDFNAVNLNNIADVQFVGVDTEVDPAWQMMAGIRYKLNGHSAFGLGYKYLAFEQSNGINNTVGNNAIFASYTISW